MFNSQAGQSKLLKLFSFLEHRLGILDLFLAQTPLLLQVPVEAHRIHILRPPLPPASQEDLFGVGREVSRGERAEKILGTCKLSAICELSTQNPEPTLGNGFGIRHIHRQAHARRKLGIGDETR